MAWARVISELKQLNLNHGGRIMGGPGSGPQKSGGMKKSILKSDKHKPNYLTRPKKGALRIRMGKKNPYYSK